MTTLLLTFAIVAPAPKAEPKADHPLIGEWLVETHVSSGKLLPRPGGKPERITITRDRWKIGVKGMTESCLSIDPKKDPPQMDIWVPTQGDEDPCHCSGIYKLEGDTLIVCYRNGRDRPTKFESLPKSGNWLMTLKRVKDN